MNYIRQVGKILLVRSVNGINRPYRNRYYTKTFEGIKGSNVNKLVDLLEAKIIIAAGADCCDAPLLPYAYVKTHIEMFLEIECRGWSPEGGYFEDSSKLFVPKWENSPGPNNTFLIGDMITEWVNLYNKNVDYDAVVRDVLATMRIEEERAKAEEIFKRYRQ